MQHKTSHRLFFTLLCGLLLLTLVESTDELKFLKTQLHDLTHSREPAEVFFVIDGSTSIPDNDFAMMKSTCTQITRKLPESISVGVVLFANEAKMAIPLTKLIGSAVDSLITKLQSLTQPKGSTSTKKGLEMAQQNFSNSSCGKFVILFTDGEPTDNPYSFASELKQQATVLGLGFGTVNSTQLKALTNYFFLGQELHQVVKFIEDAIGVVDPQYANVRIDFPVTRKENFAIAEKITLQLEINNQGETAIPASSTLVVEEISRVPKEPYFYRSSLTLPQIAPGTQYTSTITLNPTSHAHISRIPKYLSWAVKVNRTTIISGDTSLYSHMFARDLHSQIAALCKGLNILLIGGPGNGKSFFTDAIDTALSTSPDRNFQLAQYCNGPTHCTMATASYRIKGLVVQDTIGVGNDNYGYEFWTPLVEGRIPSGYNSTHVPPESELQEKRPTVALLIISQGTAVLPPESAQVKGLKAPIAVLKKLGVKFFGVVTHWDHVPADSQNKVLQLISGLLEIPTSQLFPFSGFPNSTERVFETDMQVLDILTRAVKFAQAQEEIERNNNRSWVHHFFPCWY